MSDALNSLGDFLLEEGDKFLCKCKDELLELTDRLKVEGDLDHVAIYGSLAKKTWIVGSSDVDMVGYYSKDGSIHFKKLEKYLKEAYPGRKCLFWENRFMIYHNGFKIDLNLVENHGSDSFPDFLQSSNFDVVQGLRKVINDLVTKMGRVKKLECINASTKYILDFSNQGADSVLKRKFILICKFWGYSTPKDDVFRSKSMVMECLAMYSYRKSSQKSTEMPIRTLFKDFLGILVDYHSITAVFPQYFVDWDQEESVKNILKHKGPIVTDPGNITNILSVPWKLTEYYALKTLEKLENESYSLVRFLFLEKVKLFSNVSRNPISVAYLDFSSSVSALDSDSEYEFISHDCPHPDHVNLDPEYFQEFVKRNIIGSIICLYVCAQVDLLTMRKRKDWNVVNSVCEFLNNLPQKKDISGYFNVDSQFSSGIPKEIGVSFTFSGYPILVKGKIFLRSCSSRKLISGVQYKQFEELCSKAKIISGLNFWKENQEFLCTLSLETLDGRKFTYSSRASSKAQARNIAAASAIQSWCKIVDAPSHSDTNCKTILGELSNTNTKFDELKKLCQEHDFSWAISYCKNGDDSTVCNLSLTTADKLQLKFSSSGSSKAQSRNLAADLAIDKIVRNLIAQPDFLDTKYGQ